MKELDVVRRGTGARAMELGRRDLAGKTGTTNEQRDAWFSGYNSHIVTSVWVGFDNHDPLGRRELGGRAALPVWIEYMRTAPRPTTEIGRIASASGQLPRASSIHASGGQLWQTA